jgi:hypothetical protein
VRRFKEFSSRAMSGEERLWKIWWLGGIPVALLATLLTLAAELLRVEGHHSWGEFIDVVKLLVYAAWFTAAWRCAEKAERPLARTAGRIAVAAGVLAAALTV